MKLICIYNLESTLELYKIYETYDEWQDCYIVNISSNDVGLFNKERFISLQEFRTRRIEYIEGIYG